LLAPPSAGGWSLLWSSESIAYGGQGTAPLTSDGEWKIQGETALLLHSALAEDHDAA
jgi:maltooligosyltrehalose trehalohydrolase